MLSRSSALATSAALADRKWKYVCQNGRHESNLTKKHIFVILTTLFLKLRMNMKLLHCWLIELGCGYQILPITEKQHISANRICISSCRK